MVSEGMDRSSSFSRRRFLRGTAVAGAAAMAPGVIPSHVLGQSSANERINIGVIGTGGQGLQHIAGGPWTVAGGFVARRDVQVVAVCDAEQGRRDNARRRVNEAYAEARNQGTYRGCDAFINYRELLARPDVDAVLIASPDHWHAQQSIDAMRAGKDVYCEKPITLTIGEARQVRQAVHRLGRVYQAGTQQRSSPAFRRACELVRSGRIGRLVRVHVNVGGTSTDYVGPAEPVPAGVDWDMWLGPAPMRPYSARIHRGWMGYRDYSGGEMTNWGAHHFDIAQWGIGADHTGPAEIFPPDGREHRTLTCRFADGVLVHHGGHPREGVTFIGTEGTINTSRWYCESEPASIARSPLGPNDVHLYESNNHHDNFFDCIRTRRRPAAHIDPISRSIILCHLGNIAYWLNRPLRWDPAAERFIDDEVANRWLDRARREPWVI
jgi:predicted dehydrogenase